MPASASSPRPRGRFAPSPTGPLHFGSLIAALASYCDSRARGGEWLLRIEDVDEPRSRSGAEEAILRTLSRYGFVWDGPVERQSARSSRYHAALATLVRNGQAYPCTCTRRELEAAPLGACGERVYPGTCRDGIANDGVRSRPRAWRVRVGDATVCFTDRLQGSRSQDLSRDVGDFVVKRSDGLFAYQLAVVVDDAEQAITDVVRGADLLPSTPRQIHLQRLLGSSAPEYLHIPVAINAEGEKLSKQTHALALPDDALQPLLAAWHFLDQPAPPRDDVPDVAAFWRHALSYWTPARLPPVSMLPAPARFAA